MGTPARVWTDMTARAIGVPPTAPGFANEGDGTISIFAPLDPLICDRYFSPRLALPRRYGWARDRERYSVQTIRRGKTVQSVRAGVLVTFIIGAASLGQPRVAHADVIRVAMLPVSVNSSLSDTGHLSAGLADMVSARLEQNGQIVIIRLDAPATSREDAIEAGKKVGAEYVLFGSYTQFGDGASLDLRCARVAAEDADEPRRVFIQAGSASEIIPKLGVLSENVTRYLMGAAAASGPAAGGDPSAPGVPEAAALADIEERLEALERVIFAPPAAAVSASEPAAE